MSQTKPNRSISIATKPAAATLILTLSVLLFTQEAAACAACGCLVSKDWQAQGISSEPGFTVGLTYDYIKQDQQSIGTGSSSTAALLTNNPNSSEVEQLTTTQITTLNINYNSTDWGVDLQMPYVSRYHETNNPIFNTSQSDTIGDARVTGRYAGFSDDQTWGVILGIKLPTGPINATFSDGVSPLDRSLQPGTGSTDAIVGLYKAGQIDQYGWFVQGLFQAALSTKSDDNNGGDYRPGDSRSLNFGVRYATFGQKVTPMLQVNMISRRSDSGPAATPLTTGGDLVYLTPGVSVRFGGGTTGFAFLQIPIYQNVNASDTDGALGTGSQLTAKSIFSLGVKHSF